MIYRVRVILDAKNTVFRDIDIKDKQSLWNLHLAIMDAFNLKGEELSSFYYSDDSWSEGEAIPLEDLSDDGDGDTMSDIYISEAFSKVGSKMLFKYGLLDLSEFFCELMEIIETKSALSYPRVSYRFGNLSLKNTNKSSKNTAAAIDDSEDDLEDMDQDFEDDDVLDDFDELEADSNDNDDEL